MLKRLKKLLILIPTAFLMLSVLWVFIYREGPVRWTPLMLKRTVQNIGERGYENARTWVGLDDISPVMVRAVVAAEDGRFMEHHGFDFKEMKKMQEEHETKGKKIRGCSTISQQVAKNCFTFCGRTWWRKGFEAYYTVLIEILWSKERIMEVYLNVAEMGKGVFGVEAAAQKSFGRSAAKLNTRQAVSIACVLPNPLQRDPETVSQKNRTKYNITYKRTEQTAYPFK